MPRSHAWVGQRSRQHRLKMLSGKWDGTGSSGTRVCPGWAAYLCVAGSMVRGSPSWPTDTIRDKAGPVLSHTGHVGRIYSLYLEVER